MAKCLFIRDAWLSPKLKNYVGIFQKGKIRRDFATREIQIKVHVTCLTPPPPIHLLPSQNVLWKVQFHKKKLQCYRWTYMISMKPWPYQFIHSFVNHILNFDVMKFIVFTKLFDNQSFSWCRGANDACPERLKCKLKYKRFSKLSGTAMIQMTLNC